MSPGSSRIISAQDMRDLLNIAKVNGNPFNIGDTNEIVEALFVTDTSARATNSEVSDPVRLITAQQAFKKAFEPRLVRVGKEARFEEPLINESLYNLIESLMQSYLSCTSTAKEIIFSPGIFDNVLGVHTTNLESNDAFTLQSNISADPELYETFETIANNSDKTLSALATEVVNGKVTINSIRPVIKVSL